MTTLEGNPPWCRARSIGHYGGATDKVDCSTERVPYAWHWFVEMQTQRGSAYSTDRESLVSAENIAVARSEGARTRAAERMVTNSVPATADERIPYWVDVLAVPVSPTDTQEAVRAKCAAKFRAVTGNAQDDVDDAITALLGDSLVKIWRQVGATLASPPPITYWPGVAPGPAAYNLGGGTWLSERSHLAIEVDWVDGTTLEQFLRLMNVDLYRLLAPLLPAWVTFNWCTTPIGFILDVDELDFHGVIP